MKDNELNLYWVNDLPDIRRRVDGAIVNTCEGYVSKHDKMTPQLFRLAVIGNALRVIMKRCGDENLDFPEKGFNGKFLKWIIKASPQSPCGAWCSVVYAVRVGEAILSRFDFPPSLEGIEAYRVATSPEALPKLQEMASTYTIAEPAEMPRAEEAWDAIQTRMSKGVAGAAAKHNMAFYAGQDPESAMSEATAALFDNVGKLIHESSPSYSRFLEMAFAGKWEAYLSRAFRHDLQDIAEREWTHAGYQTTGSEINKQRAGRAEQDSGYEGEAVHRFDETIEDERAYDEDTGAPRDKQSPPPLSELNIPWDKLTPAERRVFKDVIEGYRKGYEIGSKTGLSFQKYWGKHYEKNVKAFQRARRKLTP